MGYNIRLNHAQFIIKKENVKDATKALKEYADNRFSNREFDWRKRRHLEDVLKLFCYNCDYDDDDNVNDIDFNGEKLSNDEEMLNVIAPYVEYGSYIEIDGEEGEKWRWFFTGKRCIQINPVISWPTPGRELQ